MNLMLRRRIVFAAFALASILWAGNPALRAEEVTAEYDALDVLGNLEIPPGKSLQTDEVVMIVHGSLGHHRMDIISVMQELLRERGITSLAITLSLGVERRRGMFDCTLEQDHRHEDAVGEIGAWINWLKGKGASAITLAGHGRGANQVAMYAGHPKADASVRRLVLIAPLLQTFESADQDYFLRYKKVLRDELARAEQLVSRDEAATFMNNVGFLDCPNAKVTAGAFVNYYAANPKYFTPNLLPAVKAPTLVIGSGADPREPELAAAMRNLAGQKNLVFEEVAEADHYFSDAAADDLANRMAEFLKRNLGG